MKRKFFGYIVSGIISGTIVLGATLLFKKDTTIVVNKVIQENGNALQVSTNDLPSFRSAAKNSINSVVHVKTAIVTEAGVYRYQNPLYDFFFGPQYEKEKKHELGSGSGVIISNDGYIVTNNHVIEKANVVEVALNDRRTFIAKIIGRDLTTDLALLKVEASDLPYLGYGDSEHLEIGDWVLAVGNPFNLTSTVTAGIVSAKARNLNILSKQYSIESFIQTDAAVNPGNSGGALVNIQGELVGINTAIASNTGSFSGYSFAIPTSIVSKVVSDLIEFGKVQRAYIGISVLPIDSELAAKLNLKEIKGVLVTKVSEEGGAKEAGVKEGDIILNIDNHPINTFPELQEQISKYRPGDEIEATFLSNGKKVNKTILLRNKYGTTQILPDREVKILGATIDNASSNTLAKLGLSSGAEVSQLEDGPISRSGIKNGFIITAINKKSIEGVDDVAYAFNNLHGAIHITGVYKNGILATYIVYNR